MVELEIIGPDERVELLDGELFLMPPMTPPHAFAMGMLASAFYRLFGDRAWVVVQSPIILDDFSAPMPDLMMCSLPKSRFARANPRPDDALLVVEVSKTTLRFDRTRKLAAYARRRAAECWIVDLVHDRIEVYREPHGEGYRQHLTAERGESIAPAAFPDDAIAVDDILPPPEPSLTPTRRTKRRR